MRGTRPRTPSGASNLAVSLHTQNLSPVDGSDLLVFLDLFPKVGKTTRPVIRLHSQVIATVVESVFPVSLPPPAMPGRAGPGRAGPRRAVTVGRPGFGTRPAARLRRTRPGRASACDRRPGFGTRPGFGAHDRARFRHAASSTDPQYTGRTLSFSSSCPTITLLRSSYASSPHLASGSLLLPPFTHRSARNSVEKNEDRHLRFPN